MFQRYQGEGLPSRARYRPYSYPGLTLRLALGLCPSRLYHTHWPDICSCITISGTKGGVLICHRNVMRVPLAMKTRVLTTISVGHVPITEGTTKPATSNNLPQNARRPHHFGPTCTFQGHFILWVPGSRFSEGAEDCFHYRPRVLPDYWCP